MRPSPPPLPHHWTWSDGVSTAGHLRPVATATLPVLRMGWPLTTRAPGVGGIGRPNDMRPAP